MKNIGVIKSGGDALGMNATIPAVVRIACLKELSFRFQERMGRLVLLSLPL